MFRRTTSVGVAGLLMWAIVAQPAGAVIPGVGVVSRQNMDWVWNYEAAAGSDIEFYEVKEEDGSFSRYAIYGSMGNGFNVVDITDPALPVFTGAFVDPGVNWQGDIQVNPRRDLVVFSTEGSIGRTASHGGGDGLAFVDISNPAMPTLLGTADGVDGAAHNATIISDEIVYTLSPVYIVDYTDPADPVEIGRAQDTSFSPPKLMCNGHDITVDPNRTHIIYNACGSRHTEIWDVSDPRNPRFISEIRNSVRYIAHQADPNLDSSLLFVTDEYGGGTGTGPTPGGGVHVYDISGKYVEGASLQNPQKVGHWVAPFYGLTGSASAGGQWGNMTAHNMTFQAERNLLSIAWYTMGSFVTDMSGPTVEDGLYDEYQGDGYGGPTTWGNTQGNILLEGAETWSTKWTRFDDSLYDDYLFTSDITRGFDVLEYTGPMPKKQARLSVDGVATAGDVTGVLDRYAVWTYEGWVNKPLAGKVLTVSVAGGPSVTTTAAEDGSFSADLNLAAGTHEVTVTWTDDEEVYDTAEVTRTVTA